jgi:hypothetical protein
MESYVDTLSGIRLGNLVSNAPEVDMCLSRDQVFKMNGDKRGIQIVCQEGSLWVTQADDPKDYVLVGGDRFIVTKPGLVVIQGVLEGRARIIPRALGR